ncbi:MAG: xanthine dehydrogenase family protein molybdopterin-binding subunit [Rhodospirillaceae bacterium]
MGQFGIGQPVSRFEDPRLLTGRGQYLDDINLPNQARGYILRSPYAHAKINSIDASAAKAAPGVIGVFTGEDHEKDGLGAQVPQIPRKRPDGSDFFFTPQPALVKDAVKFVGDYVAFVVAETLDQAKDAAELIEVDFEPLPAVVDTFEAAEPGAPKVWKESDDNIAFLHDFGNREGMEEGFAKAKHIVKQRFVINRITANSMEVRGAIGDYQKDSGRYVLHTGSQGPHAVRNALANEVFKVPVEQVQVITKDMGGGFGMKGGNYPEYTLCLWASRELGRPVKWVSDRTEAIHTDNQARDNVTEAELALDENGKFLALKVRTRANVGAYYNTDRLAFPAITHIGVLSGPYTTGAIHDEISIVMTNTNMTAPYRGAGRPEAAYVMERMVDLAADELGIDRVELRRRNYIPEDAIPYETGFMYTYDSGRFEENMDICMKNADYDGFEARREEAKSRGKLRGLGLSNTIELAQGMPTEASSITIDENGHATFVIGTKGSGQGHDTMYKQMLYTKLGIDTNDATFVDGDTDQIDQGGGTFGSRSTFMGGSALYLAADKVIEKGVKIAAHVMEAAETDIEFADGSFTIAGTDLSMSITEVAKAAHDPAKLPAGMEVGLEGSDVFKTPAPTFPNGCHICEVEIDPETGFLEIAKYTVVDDVGVVVNPLMLKGQIHGGVAQGLGQILMEDLVYDKETGQMLTGSFMDYAMPRAIDFCHFEVASNEVKTSMNPLGAKGGGEAGTVGSLPAAMNAMVDALKPLGINHIDLPATPRNIWNAIQLAKA